MFTASLGIFLFGLLAAAAGGYIGAAIGGNFAFVLTGFSVIFAWAVFMGTGSDWGFNYVAFGPFAGPYVMFAGGAAAAAYAWHKGYLESGKDINSALAGLGKTDVLHVGAAFGVFGYLFKAFVVDNIPWFGTHTDGVALTVVTSALLARVLFGKRKDGVGSNSLIDGDKFNKNASGFLGKIAPREDAQWLPWQEKWSYLVSLGFFFGSAAAAVAIVLGHAVKGGSAFASSFAFGISAIIILFLIMGFNMPVQHHITVVSGVAAVTFLPIIAGSGFDWNGVWTSSTWTSAAIAVVVSGIVGILTAWLVEFWARVWYDRGTTHIDPPASGIWIMTTAVLGLGTLLG
ncbi:MULTISPECIES: hypothetical protein [unclassified Luteococcus]|uniref:hypothetical protein n=1 Tax=unclassified Luteococcus TaxID=2639923 RepID=UPI00313DFA9A